MDEPTAQPPVLFELLFGSAAAAARNAASPRLLRWSAAFDAWLAERQQGRSANTTHQTLQSWRRLLAQCPKTPWEMQPADIEAHVTWMRTQGYSSVTIYKAISNFSFFYNWCSAHAVDPHCPPGFNPAASVPRPTAPRYARARLLSRGEVRLLLGLLARDGTPLGRRDYAFILARTRLGVSLGSIQRLQWGQILVDGSGAWVRWRPEKALAPFPGEVWEAIHAWLVASGRMARMRPNSFIFVPVLQRFHKKGIQQPDAWDEGHPLSQLVLLRSLKLYGRLVGIREERLTLRALRDTALRLRLDAGADLVQLGAFAGSKMSAANVKYYLRRLPEIPPEAGGLVEDASPPERGSQPWPPGHSRTHGLSARSQPAVEVQEVLAEDLHGLAEEIVGLRTLARGLLELQSLVHNSAFAARLADAYTLAASRLAAMIASEKELAEGSKSGAWAEQVLAMLDNVAAQLGEEPVSSSVRLEALGGQPDLAAAALRLVEEVASARLVLRNTLALAEEAYAAGVLEDTIRLAEVYGQGCHRLVRLLRAGGADTDRLAAYLQGTIQEATRQVLQELEAGRGEG